MRCFVAINLPEEVKENVKKIVASIPENGIKKVAPENLHLTLKFLGEIGERAIRKVENKLSEIKFNKFLVELKDIGFFPNRNFVRVVWVGVGEGREEIEELQKKIDEKLNELFKKEENFEPHLTIARVKFLKDKKIIQKLEKIKFEDCFEVESFELMESILQKNGPRYKVIKSFRCI